MNLVQAAQLTEEQAREYMEGIRWADGPKCHHCSSQEVTHLAGESARPGVFQCNNCRQQFTVTTGTIMEDSHVPLNKWVLAFHLLCSSKKGMSALQLQRELGLGSYRTAWYMAHRIRHAMRSEPSGPFLKGTVEVDETYVGGKPRKGTGKHKRGRGTKKTPVVALVERDGNVRAKPVEQVTAKNLKAAIRENVQQEARIVTDELSAYTGVGNEFTGGHETVKHGAGEYARGDVHTNTVESYFALLKRGVYGTFHHVGKQHLHRYCDEFSFRWDHRKVTDGVRTEAAIAKMEGKRLQYKATTSVSGVQE
jgi:transposase-like protein